MRPRLEYRPFHLTYDNCSSSIPSLPSPSLSPPSSQGLSSIGKSDLSEGEFQSLCRLYPDPKREGHVRWKDFVSVIEAPGNDQNCIRTKFLPAYLTC